MNKLLFLLSLWLAKLISCLISILHIGQASNFPGKIALKIKKDLIKYFNINSSCKIILVTGTNGKSTTCGLLANILKVSGFNVIFNKSGANLLSGIASMFCHHSTLFGKLKYDYIVLEVDEATLPLLTSQIKPHFIAITNFFRDQLDRFGELDATVKLIEKGIDQIQDCTLILNADDYRVAFIKATSTNTRIYYGLEYHTSEDSHNKEVSWQSDPQEITTCPKCSNPLTFSSKSLAHLGNYKCNKCTLEKPLPNYLLTNIQSDHLTINFDIVSLSFTNNKNNFFLPMIGTFNLYNAACAISIAKTITNITNVQIQKGLQTYSTIFGRGEKITIHNKTAWIYLIKNPTGTTEVLRTLVKIPNARFLIAINDNFADGRDVSWLWDSRFDILSKHKKDIYVSGKRAYDMALRLKYADYDINKIKVNERIKDSVKEAVGALQEDEILYILPTYTVLLEMQRKGLCKNVDKA